ncbi:putative fimbrial FimF precursor [Escherichia coli]|jgi:hypothetical protein|nr:putative fimbrial FimF precursor [Escherichia coli]
MNITMSPQQPMLSVTKAIPFQSGIFADVWRVTQERYYQVKKVCRTALINPALIWVRVAFNGIEDAENNTLLKLDEGSNTASGLGIEILDANMRPVKLNDLHAGMQWIPLVPEQNNILPYSARLKSTQKSVNPGLVRASATFTLEFQ